jgi:3D (Asp-Asp-Asp) domain-containing protein
LRKAKVKHFSVVFLNLMTLRVAICILGLITNIARTKTDDPITLLRTTISEVETSSAPVLEKSGKAEPEEIKPENTPKKQSDNSESNTELTHFLAKASSVDEWESIEMRVTAYCPCPKCCGEYSDGVTACGHEIQPGDTFVAADRRYPFGTEMLIPGYSNSQPVRVLDRGGAIKGNRLDVFFATHQEALEWGVKYLEVKVNHK